jgi:hypothetical protein
MMRSATGIAAGCGAADAPVVPAAQIRQSIDTIARAMQ